ncbi:hypothetical protein [Fructobacillus papyrifericola]|uniref:Uncharacterized protein n=1 Tax=Fructobacillus papyrifericola TaxID=2713172 RepID=A0ABS5QXW1_9LACO|nr:hypothetical protein [Fructobacillus papyrifericola]MBS9336717.1 hypothetical protein [Fructobacillus papyrifericola]
MKIEELQLRRKEYWLSLQAIDRADDETWARGDDDAESEEEAVLDYRVLCFSYEDYLVIDWTKTYPGPNPLNLIGSRLQNADLTNLTKSHGIISFETPGVRDRATYRVRINTVRS